MEKIRQEATASTRGTIYQLCVAVQQCYELRKEQKLLIEELGDVTIENKKQTEVKNYSDNLYDGHHNFWNTIRNWIADEFDFTQYKALILHTTQEFGPKATIKEWNGIGADKRLELLLAINKRFESAYKKMKAANPKTKPSAVLKHQRFILDSQKRQKLRDLAGKVWIEAKAKQLPELYEELKQDRIRGILSGKKDDYLDSLIGFVCRADKKAGERWEITYDEWEAKIGDLNTIYNNETRRFPRKHFIAQRVEDTDAVRDDLFIKKIREIEYFEVICSAIRDYEATMATIDQEFTIYTVDPKIVESYSFDTENRFMANYRTCCRNCTDEVKESQDLYDKITGSPAPALSGFGDTPDGFRNGLLHQRMDNPDIDLRWRLCKK